jgi:hypothetical protein
MERKLRPNEVVRVQKRPGLRHDSALLLRRVAARIAGSALVIVGICLKLGGLVKISEVGLELVEGAARLPATN